MQKYSRIRIAWLLLSCLLYASSFAQAKLNTISASSNLGIIYDPYDDYNTLILNYIPSYGLDFFLKANHRNGWTDSFDHAVFGISLHRANLQNPDVLGSLTSVNGLVNLVPFQLGRVSPGIGLSLGVTYSSNPYHPVKNFKNVLIGSRVLATFGVSARLSLSLTEKLVTHAGFELKHFSNGQMKLPNYGMNLISVNGGFGYELNSDMNGELNIEKKNYDPGLAFYLTTGKKEIDFFPGMSFRANSFSIEKTWQINNFQHVGTGISLFYDESNTSDYQRKFREQLAHHYNYTGGFYLTYELTFYPVIIPVHMGWYAIHGEAEYRSQLFNRFGLRYFIHEHFCINITHKSDYFFRGDNIEWGIGYKF
ncbi:MAG: acyloxyacyl hydrolase [Bacteroidales bacterium]